MIHTVGSRSAQTTVLHLAAHF